MSNTISPVEFELITLIQIISKRLQFKLSTFSFDTILYICMFCIYGLHHIFISLFHLTLDYDTTYLFGSISFPHDKYTYHSINMPRTAFVGELICGAFLSLYLPYLGLRMVVATRPVMPPTRCTGPAPAISTIPKLYSHPPVAHTQWAGNENRTVFATENTM